MSMGQWVVTTHMGTGSMAEGMQPEHCYGPFGRDEAMKFADAYYEAARVLDSTIEQELLTCVSMVDDVRSVQTIEQLVRQDFADWIEDEEDERPILWSGTITKLVFPAGGAHE